MVQATFTRQKRELAKAASWIERLRAHEIRKISFDAEGKKLTETRETYVDYPPEEVARQVLGIVVEVVRQHGARQRANGKNTGRFVWRGIEADLTVPQLRALKEAHATLATLVQKLPRRNPKVVHNTTVDGRPAFAGKMEETFEQRVRYKPYEEDATTRVRTYEEHYREKVGASQQVEIDYGLEVRRIQKLEEMVTDLGTAIQVAIDEANGRGHEDDPVLSKVIDSISKVFDDVLPPRAPSSEGGAGAGPSGL
ncbi:DUF7873 family protein [Polyangium jinanense]|uniref:Uncharacterized protein n=1 Tax=Polyangium jinanense TaxID=2829994 RepID=A0A9X3XBQ0_9BACT|nr:hypothetical protein [Polyangium jinanense]MDC3958960.1 hypothetical protein [Polyangium jinanense]MDC3986415.1 hypothetical protein [Polyangium jinanense]